MKSASDVVDDSGDDDIVADDDDDDVLLRDVVMNTPAKPKHDGTVKDDDESTPGNSQCLMFQAKGAVPFIHSKSADYRNAHCPKVHNAKFNSTHSQPTPQNPEKVEHSIDAMQMSPQSTASADRALSPLPSKHRKQANAANHSRARASSAGSQVSLTSTTSTVSSIDDNLELCATILRTVEDCTNNLSVSNKSVNYDQNQAREHLSELDLKKTEISAKIQKLMLTLAQIEGKFNTAIDEHKQSMLETLAQQQQKGQSSENEPLLYAHQNRQNYKNHYEVVETDYITHGATAVDPEPLQQQRSSSTNILSDDENKYTLSTDDLHADEDDNDDSEVLNDAHETKNEVMLGFFDQTSNTMME
jgi:hypothetical protein